MKRILRGLAALSALASLALLSTTPARAQALLNPNQWIIKAGVSMPAEGLAKDVSKSWLTAGLEYQLGDPNGRRVSSVEAIYSTANDDISQFGLEDISIKFQTISLMYNYRMRSLDRDGQALGNVLFYGAGLGAQIILPDIEDPNPEGFGTFDDQRTFAGANVFVGYEIAANVEIEAKYQFVFGKVLGESMNSLQLLAGLKF